DSTVYTDEACAYKGLPQRYHEAVRHSVSEYVREQAHTNGMESFRASLRRGYHGTYYHISAKHLQSYVNKFAGRHNLRRADTIDMMAHVAAGMVGKRLMYRDLTGDSKMSSGLQP
ncbi:MAG: transposase, partial [Rhodospirillaceae bacterium]|nr:transposase [Rhodospirillaceae bacterium]